MPVQPAIHYRVSLLTLAIRLGLVFAGYYVTARIGLAIPYVGSHITLVWLPTGIAVVAYLRWGPRMAIAIALAALAVNVKIGTPLWLGVAIALGNCAGPAFAAWLMRHWGMNLRLSRRKDTAVFILAAFVGMLISATNGVAALTLAGVLPVSAAAGGWISWWVGDVVGVVLGAVPLLTAPLGRWRFTAQAAPRAAEITLLFGGLLLVAGLLFGWHLSAVGDLALPLLFLPFMLVGLLALRGGLFVSSSAILALALAAAYGTGHGIGPFASGSSVHFGLLALWGYVVTLTITTMLTCALVDELDMSQKRLSALFANAHDGMLLLDASGCITEANPAAARLLGRMAPTLSGMPLWSLEPGASHRESALSGWLLRPQVDKAEQQWLYTGQLVRFDGSRFQADIECARYIDGSGASCAHLVFRDVTDRLQAEADRRKAEDAERANRAKTEFLSRMSHELRTPLNAVLGFAQLLERDSAAFPAVQRQYVDHIFRAGQHLLRLINEVLDLSRIEAGAVSVRLAPTDVALVAANALGMLVSAAQERGITLEGAADAIGPAGAMYAWADPTRLQEVLINLLDNAIKYTALGGRVWLRLHHDGGEAAPVVIEVGDTGHGIAPEQLEHLFEPFNGLGAERTNIEGSGIGLVISRQLVGLMQGRLLVQSAVGVGSVFRVELMSATAHTEIGTLAQAGPTATPTLRGVRRVLYVEDCEVNGLLMQAMLESHPEVLLDIATTGAQGLACAERNPPDLVLIDMHLPDTTGLEVLHAMRAMPGLTKVPCIAASADAMPETISMALDAGFNAYLTKPLLLDELVRCIESHLAASPD
jgi:PAS domain S-box-containing protein